jgi:hypothetical protein
VITESLILFISLWNFIHCSFTLIFISFYCNDAQYTRLRTLHSLSVFSDDSASVGDVPVFLRCLLPRCVTRCGMSCCWSSGKSSVDMRSEFLRSKQETAVVQQENAVLRQRIERTGISFCARPWITHIYSCFTLSICARPRLAHINSCFAREYALGSTCQHNTLFLT